jgi:ligand-binding sensor domain-containing protein
VGLYRYDRTTGKFILYQADPQNPQALISRNVHRIFEDKFGNLWIGTEAGISKMDRRQNTFINYKHDPNNPASLAGNYIFAIHEDSESRLWFGGSGSTNDLAGRLSRYEREADAFVVYRHDPRNPAGLSSGRVFALCEDRNKFLWVGTETGLNRFDPVTGKFSHYRLQPRNGETPSPEQIGALYLDNAGILWIGTVGDGLYRYQSARKKFPHIRHDPNDSRSLSAPIVQAFCEDRNGNLWVGTAGGGLNRYDPGKNEFIQYRHDPNDPKSLSSDFITALCEDRRGYLWVGPAEKGLNRWHEKDGTFIHYRDHYPPTPQNLSSDHLICLFEDSKGNLWVGTKYGVCRYDYASDTFIKYGLDSTRYRSNLPAFAIYEDSEDRIWICEWNGGVTRLDTSLQSYVVYRHAPDDPSTISSNIVLSAAEQRNGNLWFGTWGGGLNRFHRETETFTRYTSADGLPNDVVFGLLSDEQGNLWISTFSGLAKFNPESRVWKTYDTEDGIQAPEFRHGACHKGRSGRFYFGGVNGFNAFYPEEIKDNPHIPLIVLTSFKILDREISPQRIGGNLEQLREIKLSHGENYLSFEFAALDFINPRKNQYAYRLEGLDEDWIYSGARRFASYTNLAPGNYMYA